jgi:flagellar basal-body rod modification protein FlgD
MPVDAIGSVLNQASAVNTRATISQQDFIRLFLAQLQFQDPLEPLDNREFLAQLAAFSGLEQAKQTTAGVESLLTMSSSDQAMSLLNRSVQVTLTNGVAAGTVTAVKVSGNGVELTVQPGSGAPLTGIRLPQVSLIQP